MSIIAVRKRHQDLVQVPVPDANVRKILASSNETPAAMVEHRETWNVSIIPVHGFATKNNFCLSSKTIDDC